MKCTTENKNVNVRAMLSVFTAWIHGGVAIFILELSTYLAPKSIYLKGMRSQHPLNRWLVCRSACWNFMTSLPAGTRTVTSTEQHAVHSLQWLNYSSSQCKNFQRNIHINRNVVHGMFHTSKYLQIKQLRRVEDEIMAETALRVFEYCW